MHYTKYAFILSFLSLAGCESSVQAPVEELRPQYSMNHQTFSYTVRPGDTLYAIAFLYDQNAKQLASLNGISYPYSLHTGQVLRLSPKITQPRHQQFTQRVAQKINWTFKGGDWAWPTRGQIASNSQNPIESKGLNILGHFGQPIYASKAGVVAYAGNGLPGYGQLILVKHSNDYLTAYAFNSKLLVREGQMIQKGQQIAAMGNLSPGRAGLHFEIRYRGVAVNPSRFLK